jgi:hypothetical protein
MIDYQRPVLPGLHHRHSARLLQRNVTLWKGEADDSIEKKTVFFHLKLKNGHIACELQEQASRNVHIREIPA